MNGVLDVLNVGHGHLTFRFDKEDPAEVEKAKKVITDMLRRGYMLFVKVDGEQTRVREFDPATEEYILEEPDVLAEAATPAAEVEPRRRRGPKPGRRAAMRTSEATGIGPTAGG
jgi:hypothetical protein